MEATVTRELAARRQRFDELNDVAVCERKLEALHADLETCADVYDLRKKSALRCEIARWQTELERRLRKREMFDELAADAREAVYIVSGGRRWHRKEPEDAPDDDALPPLEADATEGSAVSDTALLLEDVTLIYEGGRLQDARTRVDDICSSCGSKMERNIQQSYLVCCNLACGHMRWYMDTSTYGSGAYSTRSETAKNATKCVTHYATFINTAQGQSSKRRFTRQQLDRICYFCFVQGARKPEDITRPMINMAQRFCGKAGYSVAPIIRMQLTGYRLRIPPSVVRCMLLLFKVLHPVFLERKHELAASRSNMINFNFASRVIVRLLGYDVFLPLFDKFVLQRSTIKHSAFMRKLFRSDALQWKWEDQKLTEIPDAMLDEYDARQAGNPKATALGELAELELERHALEEDLADAEADAEADADRAADQLVDNRSRRAAARAAAAKLSAYDDDDDDVGDDD